MSAVKTLVIWLSYLFHTLFALFLLGLTGLGMASGPASLHLGMLPWSGATLEYVLLGGALFGLLSIALAVVGKLRFLFTVWALGVVVLATKGYIFSGYRFVPGEAHRALYFVGATWFGLCGALLQLGSGSGSGPRKYRVK